MSYSFLSQLEHDLQMEGFGLTLPPDEMGKRFPQKLYPRFSAVASDKNKSLLAEETPAITRLANLLQSLPSNDPGEISNGFGVELYAAILADNQGPWVLCHVERARVPTIVPLWPVDTVYFEQAFPKPPGGITPESYLILSVQWPVWYATFNKRGFSLAHASAGALLAQIDLKAAAVGLRATAVISLKTATLEQLMSLPSETESVLYAVTLTPNPTSKV